MEGRAHDRVIATAVAAFIADPVERWLWPEASEYLAHFPAFVSAFGPDESAVSASDDFAAVAIWTRPGAQEDGEQIAAVLRSTVAPERHADAFAVVEQMDRAHPSEPHWYLSWLAVDPARQNAGLGGVLLERDLARVDADHLPTYLDTPNPRTIPFYERHGFSVVSVSQAGACPPMTGMLRAAR